MSKHLAWAVGPLGTEVYGQRPKRRSSWVDPSIAVIVICRSGVVHEPVTSANRSVAFQFVGDVPSVVEQLPVIETSVSYPMLVAVNEHTRITLPASREAARRLRNDLHAR